MQLKTRIRFVDSAATTTTQYVRGQSYELDAHLARQLVECGAAVIEEPDQTPKRGKRDAVSGNHPAH